MSTNSEENIPPEQTPPVSRNLSALKKLLKSKRFWLSSLAVLALACAAVGSQTQKILDVAKREIEHKALVLLPGHETRLGKFSTNFLNKVSVSGVEVSNEGGFGDGAFLKIERVDLRFGLRDVLGMLRHRK